MAPLVQLQCASTACGELTVAWTADAAHTHVDVTLNDATPVRLPAGAAPYTLAVTGGVHVVAAQGVDAQGRASAPRFCEHRVQTCVLAGVAVAPASCGAVSLSWAPGRDDGTFVEVAVDGTPVALFPGALETGGAFTLGTLAAGAREICLRPIENGVEGEAVCALVDVAACAGPGIGPVRCSLPGNGQVLLEWECDAILDGVRVERNGVLIAVLSGSARSFADAPPEPGTVRYRVIGEAAGADGPPGTCAVRVGSAALAPVRALACAAEGCGRVRLTWEAGAVYDGIRVLRNGELVAVCAGDAAGYHDAPLAEGVHEYGVVAFAGAQISTPVWCETRVEPCSGPAAPSRLVCTPSGCEAADLAWQPQDAYDRIEIMRDGLVVAVLAADADAWHDAEAGAGMHQWCVTGFRGVTGSVPACAWLALDACAPLRAFIRGDANGDGEVDIGDAITILGYLFAGNPEPQCLDAADANDDASLDIGDAIAILGLLFGDAGALPPPYPSCGFDPTVPGEALGCVSYPHCDP